MTRRANPAPSYDPREVERCTKELEGSCVIPVQSRHMFLSVSSEAYHLAWEALRRPAGAPLGNVGPTFAAVTPPVSREFIEQRADIDEPQRGFLVRRRDTGRLQGFVWATTFTHWVHYFRWDSLATPSGLRRPGAGDGRALDVDGSLAEALEAQPRSGDPAVSGVVWPTVAEVALLGALGCGGYLLRLLLEQLAAEAPQYRYVVVQATANSVAFYERHGFVRVGAVARYSRRRRAGGAAETVGYRHWLATDEELHSSDKPSYMMARALPPPSRNGVPPSGSLLAALPALVPKRLPAVQPGPVPPELAAASAAVDALAAGAVDRAVALLEAAEGRGPAAAAAATAATPRAASPAPPARSSGGAGAAAGAASPDVHHHALSSAVAAAGGPSAPATGGGGGGGARRDNKKKSRSGSRPSKAEAARRAEAAVLETRRLEKAARAKAAAQRRAADRAAGLPPRPRGRPPKNRPPGWPAGAVEQAGAPPSPAQQPQAPPPPAPATPADPTAAHAAAAAAAAAAGAAAKARPRPSGKRPREGGSSSALSAAAAAMVKRLKPTPKGPAPGSRSGLRSAQPPQRRGSGGAGKTRAAAAAATAADAATPPPPRGLWARINGWLGAQ